MPPSDFKASQPSFRPAASQRLPTESARAWRGGALAAVLVLVIVLGSVLAYRWLVNDVHQRRSAMEGALADNAPSVDLSQMVMEAKTRRPQLDSSGANQRAVCAFLLAELQRQHFDFLQPLPPFLLDHIAGELNWLREHYDQARCGPLPATLRAKDGADGANAAAG